MTQESNFDSNEKWNNINDELNSFLAQQQERLLNGNPDAERTKERLINEFKKTFGAIAHSLHKAFDDTVKEAMEKKGLDVALRDATLFRSSDMNAATCITAFTIGLMCGANSQYLADNFWEATSRLGIGIAKDANIVDASGNVISPDIIDSYIMAITPLVDEAMEL